MALKVISGDGGSGEVVAVDSGVASARGLGLLEGEEGGGAPGYCGTAWG